MSEQVTAALRALARSDAISGNLCAHFVSALPIAHAAILTLLPPFDVTAFCSSDPPAGDLADLEIDLGEGPAWEAVRKHRPVSFTDVDDSRPDPWPTFRTEAAAREVTGVYAFPLAVGALGIGAVNLYLRQGQHLSDTDLGDAEALAALTALQIVRHATEQQDNPDDEALFSRREVHQATGMVIAQLRVSSADALAILRAHAFAANQPVRAIAADVVARRISLTP